jgi:ankyrin repeat protein
MNGRGLSTKVKLAVMAVPILAIAVGLICLVPVMRPVQQGTSTEFWRSACGVKLAGSDPLHVHEGVAIYPARDGLCIFYVQGFEGSYLYAVKQSEVLARSPEVIQGLDSELAEKGPLTDRLRVYRKWRAAGGNSSKVAVLLEQEHEALRELRERRSYAGGRRWFEEERSFEYAWSRLQRYPVNVALEFSYLSGVVVFGFWPWLRRLKPWRWALHIGLLPILLCLPYFLGYSPALLKLNPSGWTLYPWIAVWFNLLGGISGPFDTVVLFSLPKPLAGLSGYDPATIWDIYSSFWDMTYGMSASSLIALSMGLAAATYTAAWLMWRRKGRERESVAAGFSRTACEAEAAQAAGGHATHKVKRLVRTAGVSACVLVAICMAIALLQLRGEVLMNSVRLGNAGWAKAILRVRPGLVRARDAGGRTALHFAETTDAAALLLSKGADVNARDLEGRTPLDSALDRGNPTIDLLLAHGADVRSADNFGNTRLHRASGQGDAIAVKMLLARGADAMARNTDGWTPLHAAEDADVAKLLLSAGADVNARDRWGDTPLHKSCTADRKGDLMKVLLAGGANVNAKANDGSTPLHTLAKCNNDADAKLLLENGADVNAEDGDRFRPLDYAEKAPWKETRDALLHAGARER